MEFPHPTFERCIIYATPNVHPVGLIDGVGRWDNIAKFGYGTMLEGPSMTKGFHPESHHQGKIVVVVDKS